jgi:CRISPR/Cas system CSM-associated protein Csm3 (group 7 of RAMP superfamily)
LEAQTPLFIGSGKASLVTDSLVALDSNGFPILPGTSMAGVIRHSMSEIRSENELSILFGSGELHEGSRVKISSGHLVIDEGVCSDELMDYDRVSVINSVFSSLPKRQHVRINHKGTADKEKAGLFDNEVVFKGARFVFEIEIIGSENDAEIWGDILSIIESSGFRLGQGTRNGLGRLSPILRAIKIYDLTNEADFDSYLSRSNCLMESKWEEFDVSDICSSNGRFTHYQISIEPEDFFIFGGSKNDEEVDLLGVNENVIEYIEGKPHLNQSPFLVVPGSSIKGALSHRVAYYYNQSKGNYANEYVNEKAVLVTGQNNRAVSELFGYQGKDDKDAHIGNVIFDDLFIDLNRANEPKILNHVAIDRFTGGAMNGQLFSEKVNSLKTGGLTFGILLKKISFSEDVIDSFEKALLDLAGGILPIGGAVTKGNGTFTGVVFRDGERISY